MRHRLALLFLLLVLVGCDAAERRHALRALPPGLQAERVEFGRNETYGLGPGGNETGFNVIRIGDEAADLAAGGGVAWLDAQPGGRILPAWHSTPVPRDDFWAGRPDSAGGSYPHPTVQAVLNRYGFGIDLPPEHLRAVDTALTTPGSFYAFGPGGLVVIVTPATRRAYVLYAG